MALLCVFFAMNSLSAQSGKNKDKGVPLDLSEQVSKLPKADGTYLLKDDGQVKIYAIVSGGVMVGLEVKNKKGEVLPVVVSEPEVPAPDAQAKAALGCKCCYTWGYGSGGCITTYEKPCRACPRL